MVMERYVTHQPQWHDGQADQGLVVVDDDAAFEPGCAGVSGGMEMELGSVFPIHA